MDFTKTIINAIKIWVNKQLSFIENKISDLEDRPSAFIQPEEPNEAPDGTLWIDTDEESIPGVGSNTAESLTFTGVVEATYNGLSPVTVNIPKVTVNGVTSDENGNIEIEVGSEQVQTDWNQNDSTQPDYIKNRTHWVEGSTYHTLNEKFIPDTIARVSDMLDSIPTPLTAQVGQTIVVKSTDENSKPTEWETVDLLTGTDDAIILAMELGLIESVYTADDGSIYTDKNGNIYTL